MRNSFPLPGEMGGLGVSSASILALPAFLASAFGSFYFLMTIFSETLEDVSFMEAVEKWLSLTNEQKSPLFGTQKNWTQPVYIKTAHNLISRMDGARSFCYVYQTGYFVMPNNRPFCGIPFYFYCWNLFA